MYRFPMGFEIQKLAHKKSGQMAAFDKIYLKCPDFLTVGTISINKADPKKI